MSIRLSKETEKRLIGSIQRYFSENMEEPIGDLKAALLLDFCVQEIGPTVYNRAIADAQAQLQDRVADLNSSCYQNEFGYWNRQDRASKR